MKLEERDKNWAARELDREEARQFRGKAARLNYLGQDRPDLQYAAKEICQDMSKPTAGGSAKVKRAARYIVGARRMVWTYKEFEGDEADVEIVVCVDSDWAGGADRKSTSGGMVVIGMAAIKHWSRTQKTRALSVGEAEYYAVVSGSAEGLGVQSLASDLGWKMAVKVKVKTDSSTAKAVAGRRGLGKLRHVELRYLWVQEAVARGRIAVKKVDGVWNPADLLTKGKTYLEFARLLKQVGAEFVEAESAQGLASVRGC